MNNSCITPSSSLSKSDRIAVEISDTRPSDSLCINNNNNNSHLKSNNQNRHHPQLTTPLLAIQSSSPSSSDSPIILDELRRFQMSLKWCALDHFSCFGKLVSFFTFVFLTIVVPIGCFLLIRAPAEDPIAFNRLVQLPESGLAAIAFFTLTTFFRSHHHHLLFLQDGLQSDPSDVQLGYTREVNRAFRGYLTCILLPSFLVELAHKILLFSKVTVSAGGILPFVAAKCILFALVLASWLYRTGIFLLVCVLFRLTCELQILRFQGLHKIFEEPEKDCDGDPNPNNSAACLAFQEHVRIRKQLSLTSHRYRFFIIGCLVTITVSQFIALLMVLASKKEKTFFNSGDLVVCSAVQLCGFVLCLMGAARITHRAQGIAAIATRWHMLVTASAASASLTRQPMLLKDQPNNGIHTRTVCYSEDDTNHQVLFASDSSNSYFSSGQHLSSFQTGQALVAYLQHNNGGITLYGFALDRGLLHTIFAFEFSLVLWILSKVVVLS